MIRIGVDTGGTFTDLVLFEGENLTVHKVRSTPDDPSRAILKGIADLLGSEPNVDIIHGSTVATNALLERKGARIALITTAGFEDVLHIGRQTRRELYNFFVEAPRTLVERGLIFGIPERMTARGEVLTPIDQDALAALPNRLREQSIHSVAVCLLHSYANPAHEQQIATALHAAGFIVSASHRVLPEYREVERWSTTAANAYVTPIMERYLLRLENTLDRGRLSVMQSNGGFISAARARDAAVQTILSGPAAGAVGALAVARAAGHSHIISFDMGGTSTDVSLIYEELGRTVESVIADIPIRLPMIDIHTVGAGGGSIAYLDAGGALRVGPRSAGADPGPVCYGTGTELTVTDANLLLGRLYPADFLGGRMKLDEHRTRSVAEQTAAQMGMSVTALAEGIVRVANSNMEAAIRVVSVQRGYDPRQFALLAFGGAGGLHACDLAAALEMHTVIIPEHSGVLSALGMLVADVIKDYSQTILRPADETSDEDLVHRFDPLIEQARRELASEGFEPDRIRIECTLDVRYRGQAYEISVPFDADYRAEFHHRHKTLYGYANPLKAIEIVNLRVGATGITNKPQIPRRALGPHRLPDPLIIQPAIFGGNAVPTPVYSRADLAPGTRGAGPALLVSSHSTTVVPPGFGFSVDESGALLVDRSFGANQRRDITSGAAPAL